MPEVQVDRGAIRFVLGGAHIMCPGLTSPEGRMDEELPAETPVVRGWSVMHDGRKPAVWDWGSGWRADLLPSADHSIQSNPRQAIRAEGKELELAIGITKMSTTDMCVRGWWCAFPTGLS